MRPAAKFYHGSFFIHLREPIGGDSKDADGIGIFLAKHRAHAGDFLRFGKG